MPSLTQSSVLWIMFSRRIEEELELRPVEERYAEELTALVRRDLAHLRPWMPWATERYSVEDAREFIRRQIRQYAEDMGFATLIFYRGRVAGSIGYNNIDWANRKTDIGYWLGPDFQGPGLIAPLRPRVNRAPFREVGPNPGEIYRAGENLPRPPNPGGLGFKPEGTHRQAEW